jgi:hypothetical protein
MLGKVLRCEFAEDPGADRTTPWPRPHIGYAHVLEGLSQEFSAQLDVRPQCLGKASDEVFDHGSVVTNLSGHRLGAGGQGFLFQLLDLAPDLLIGAEGFLKSSSP